MEAMEIDYVDLQRGYQHKDGAYRCLHCEARYEDGVIYPFGDLFETAEHHMINHLKNGHGNTLQPLLELDRKETGLSEIQHEVFKLFARGLTDKEIAQRMNVIPATVRNHRFKLREKCRQGMVLNAMMSLLDKEKGSGQMTERDQRFEISESFRVETLNNHLGADGRARIIPSKEKKKIVLLQELMKRFTLNRNYTEREVNELASQMFDDYVSIRRYLVEYGFLGRTKDGQVYWAI